MFCYKQIELTSVSLTCSEIGSFRQHANYPG